MNAHTAPSADLRRMSLCANAVTGCDARISVPCHAMEPGTRPCWGRAE